MERLEEDLEPKAFEKIVALPARSNKDDPKRQRQSA